METKFIVIIVIALAALTAVLSSAVLKTTGESISLEYEYAKSTTSECFDSNKGINTQEGGDVTRTSLRGGKETVYHNRCIGNYKVQDYYCTVTAAAKSRIVRCEPGETCITDKNGNAYCA